MIVVACVTGGNVSGGSVPKMITIEPVLFTVVLVASKVVVVDGPPGEGLNVGSPCVAVLSWLLWDGIPAGSVPPPITSDSVL